MEIRKYMEKNISAMVYIWNKVVEDGEAFPQEDFLNDKTGADFFAAQTYCGVADDNGKIVGLYILHPNNIGRCGHIANASYAVATDYRGEHIGEKLVTSKAAWLWNFAIQCCSGKQSSCASFVRTTGVCEDWSGTERFSYERWNLSKYLSVLL